MRGVCEPQVRPFEGREAPLRHGAGALPASHVEGKRRRQSLVRAAPSQPGHGQAGRRLGDRWVNAMAMPDDTASGSRRCKMLFGLYALWPHDAIRGRPAGCSGTTKRHDSPLVVAAWDSSRK